MNLNVIIKNIRKDLEESDSFFENEILIVLDIVKKRLKRYEKKKKPKKKIKTKVKVKDEWFIKN